MTIASEITRLQNDKAAICTAIENKGVTVGSVSLDDYAACIAAIPSGPSYGYIDVLVVGGGGAGGSYQYVQGGFSGGGGGGGVVYCQCEPIIESSYVVCVGAGGGRESYSSGGCIGHDGCSSSFNCITALGGGRGGGVARGGSYGSGGCVYNAGSCATGGGGGPGPVSNCSGSPRVNNGVAGGSGCQGGNGGCGCSCWGYSFGAGGGGGGAGGNGGNAALCKGGNGGVGVSNSILGTTQTFGGGGGGYTQVLSCAGAGGAGGGGCGNGSNGTYYGGGGGGGSYGGCGYQGIVVIRYKTDGSCGVLPSSTGGCKYTCGDYTIHCFTTTGVPLQFTPVYK